MCWPVDRPATHAAAGAAARGVRGLGGLFHTLGSGHSAPCRLRRDGTRGFDFLFCGGGGAVAVCFEGCCGSMCWPVDRPATHAAAGAAARGVRGGLGDSFICSGAAARGSWVFAAARGGGEFRNDGGLGGLFHMHWSDGTPPCGRAGEEFRGGIPLFIWHCTEYAYLPAILRAGVELKFRNDGGGGAIFGYNSLSNAASSSARPRRL